MAMGVHSRNHGNTAVYARSALPNQPAASKNAAVRMAKIP